MKKISASFMLSFAALLYAIELPSINIESSKVNDTQTNASQTITVVDEKMIDTFKIQSVKDLSSVVSNVNISGVGNRSDTTFTIRGISNYVTFESSVAMYVDDVPIPFSYGFGSLDMQNVKSIELLKGPQGTLFGKSAASGVINVYTKPTTKEFTSEASVGLAEYNTKEFYGRVSDSTPIEDLTYAFAITKNSSDGFSKNGLTGDNFDEKDFLGFSTKLHYKPNSPLDVSLNYTRSKIEDGGSPFKVNTKENPYLIENEPMDEFSNMENDLVSLVIKYTQENYKITSISSYAKESVARNDYIAISGGLLANFETAIEEVTQELRLNYDFENVDFLVGAFYSDKTAFDYKENQTLLTLYPIPLSRVNSLENPDENSALFSQARYYIGQNYSLMAGIRYQQTKRSFSRNMNSFTDVSLQHADAQTTWTHILPTLSLSYYGDDDSHTYLTYSKGYRPGGYSYRDIGFTLAAFKPETTDTLELGHKRAFSPTVELKSAVFYTIIDNQRINTFTDSLNSVSLSAEKAHSYGAELELSYKNDTLALFTTLGVIQAKFEEFSSNREYEGNTILDVPDMTASVGATQRVLKDYFIQSDIKYMGNRYYNISNSAKESGYTLANIGVGYEKKGWKILLYAKNLLNEKYVDFMIYTPSNNYYHFGTPQLAGFSVSKSF